MNSRCICAAMRGAFRKERVTGTRMKIPGYPSNREADGCANGSHCESGKARKRMRQSRETCLHREPINPLGVGSAVKPVTDAAGLAGIPRGGLLSGSTHACGACAPGMRARSRGAGVFRAGNASGMLPDNSLPLIHLIKKEEGQIICPGNPFLCFWQC